MEDALNDDLDQLLDMATVTVSQQSQVKKGRRAAKPPDVQQSMAADDAEEVNIDSFDFTKSTSKSMGDASQPRPRRGGWGESTDFGTSSRRKDASGTEFQDERLQSRTSPDNDDSDTDIPVIPELGQEQDTERFEERVAIAPQVVVNRVATYKELDSDLVQHMRFLTSENDVSLKLLATALSAEAELREDDVPWEWEHLFTEVSSEILAELEKSEPRHEE